MFLFCSNLMTFCPVDYKFCDGKYHDFGGNLEDTCFVSPDNNIGLLGVSNGFRLWGSGKITNFAAHKLKLQYIRK